MTKATHLRRSPLCLGHRGRGQLLLAAAWLFIGIDSIADPTVTPTRYLFHESLPPILRAGMWIATGLVATVTAWWAPGKDKWGFVALVIPPAVRFFSYGMAWILGALPLGSIGYVNGWIGAAVWAAVVAIVIHIAATPELPEAHREHP